MVLKLLGFHVICGAIAGNVTEKVQDVCCPLIMSNLHRTAGIFFRKEKYLLLQMKAFSEAGR
ncbi:hypothetical protein P4T23_14925 [Bacillus spizizenii]|nr:hypothetical protein [Bacillus spizizenii]SCV43944.1 hypothetical protein BQ1740_3807 [Bacillus subtilis]MEC1436706.1 hypothetical protein [Bacillus spizizenii]MEC1586237.1 hypothetical protein [Bacillus spizizenii]MED0870293.1 hypothetical protein [Bacillus spizizenii]MED1069158.1 hypothetical protein [Bacillus spizizenii]